MFEMGTTDFNTTISKLIADPCDAMVGSIFGGSFISFAKQASPFGLFKSKKLVWGSQMGDYTMAATLKGDFPEGLWSSSVDLWYYEGGPALTKLPRGAGQAPGQEGNRHVADGRLRDDPTGCRGDEEGRLDRHRQDRRRA